MVSRKGSPTLPKPAAMRDIGDQKPGKTNDHFVKAADIKARTNPPGRAKRRAKQLSRFVSRRFPLDVAKAPFDNHAGSGFTMDDDLGATARPIRRREKNAFLDA